MHSTSSNSVGNLRHRVCRITLRIIDKVRSRCFIEDLTMDVEQELVKIAALVGEPARAKMLWNLLGGQARPAGELAYYANVSAQNASAHLAKLVDGGLLAVETRGRHRYYRLANLEVAHAVESLAALTSSGDTKSAGNPGQPPRTQTPDLKFARTCYDHLAG